MKQLTKLQPMKFAFLSLCLSCLTLTGCSESAPSAQVTSSDESLSATATLVSENTVTISPPSVTTMWQFKVQYLARENQSVKKGDIIVRFDSQQLRNDLMSKQSQLDAALKEQEKEVLEQEQQEQDLRLALAEAKKNLDKEKRKAEIVDASISGIEREKQQKQYKIAQLQFAQAEQVLNNFFESKDVNSKVTQGKVSRLQADVARIQQDIQKLNIRAPKDGIVMYLPDNDGEKPAVGDSVWQGQQIMTIPSLEDIVLEAQFDEPDLTKVAIGRPVKVTLDAYPELPFTGEITSLGQAFKNKSRQNKRIVFDAYISLGNIDPKIMRPGMQGKVELLDSSTSSRRFKSKDKTLTAANTQNKIEQDAL